jgi:hypothetical protein
VPYAGTLVISSYKITLILRNLEVTDEAMKSYYNNLIEIFTNKVKTMWNIIKNNTDKFQRADNISERKLGTGNIEDAKEIACVLINSFINQQKNYMLIIQTYTWLYNN